MRTDINYLKTYAIFAIVIWHCFFCPFLCWNLISTTPPTFHWLRLISDFFMPDCSMPLFTFVSGYLFYHLYHNHNKYRDGKKFFKKKFLRLIVPFLTLGTIYSLTTPGKEVGILYGLNGHFWFLVMLFWCFAVTWVAFKCNKYWFLPILAFFSLCFIAYMRGTPWYNDIKVPLGLGNSLFYYSYFYLGCLMSRYSEFVSKHITTRNGAIALVLIYVFIFVTHAVIPSLKIMHYVWALFLPFVYNVTIFAVFGYLVGSSRLKQNRLINDISIYGIGIYIIHQWINWNVVHIDAVRTFMNDHVLWFPAVLTVAIFIVSYALSVILFKNRYCRMLLGS